MKYEGKNAVRELLASGKNVDKILVQNTVDVGEIVKQARNNGVKVQFVEKKVLDEQSETKKHQGIIGFANDFVYSSLEEIVSFARKRGEHLLVLLLDGIEDPHNLGSILRSAECSGAHGVIIPKNRAVSVTETVVRVSSGASEHIKVARVTNINKTIEDFKKMGVFVFATEMKGSVMYNTDLRGDIGLVIGSEGSGVSSLTKKLCDGVISIPMFGKLNSLNASVSAGIVLFEAVRQRKFGGGKIAGK